MKKKATDSQLWAVLVSNFQDLQEIEMHIPVRSHSPSVLKRNGGNMAQFSEETGAAWSLEFLGLGLFWKQPER